MQDPRSTTPQSIMPAYTWLFDSDLDYAGIQKRVDAMAMLGVPYGEAVLHAENMARAQAKQISADIVAQGGPTGLEQRKIIALVAYLQRLGTDIKKLPPAPAPSRNQAQSSAPSPGFATDIQAPKAHTEGL
jgi:cytochrome c oxidase cbb3-type subunit I/II